MRRGGTRREILWKYSEMACSPNPKHVFNIGTRNRTGGLLRNAGRKQPVHTISWSILSWQNCYFFSFLRQAARIETPFENLETDVADVGSIRYSAIMQIYLSTQRQRTFLFFRRHTENSRTRAHLYAHKTHTRIRAFLIHGHNVH